MSTWIALFRGINVGGHRTLGMKDLTALFERAGYTGVRTYIQSGNVVFRSARATTSPALSRRITKLVTAARDFEPYVSVLSLRELSAAVAGNPFGGADADPKSLHLFFLAEAPLSVEATARNWRTVNRLLEMAQAA